MQRSQKVLLCLLGGFIVTIFHVRISPSNVSIQKTWVNINSPGEEIDSFFKLLISENK